MLKNRHPEYTGARDWQQGSNAARTFFEQQERPPAQSSSARLAADVSVCLGTMLTGQGSYDRRRVFASKNP